MMDTYSLQGKTHWFDTTLDQIAIKHQTDKASQFSRTYAKPHDYCRHYERVFGHLRNDPIRLLEIGVGGGESIQTWLEYFPNALIYGIDINSDTNVWNDPKASPHGRYTFACGNQGDAEFWATFISDYGTGWSIIVDDGSHGLSDIITTFNTLWPNVVSGGLYCIEDLADGHASWISDRMRVLNMADTDCDSIYLSRQLAILRKR